MQDTTSGLILQLAIGGEVVGGGVAGFLAGYAARKIWNFIKVVVAAVLGIQVFFLAWLETNDVITVHWDEFGNFLTGLGSGTGNFFANATNQILGLVTGVLPAVGGMTVGALLGWKKGA